MKLPKKISPCPIIEAVVEIRFESSVAKEVIIGKLYNFIIEKFPESKVTRLPILQLPGEVLCDPNLKFNPHYNFLFNNLVFQFGPQLVAISNSGDYIGWDDFSKILLDNFSAIMKLDILTKVIRLGIRYINFFENMDIYKNISLEVKLNDKPLESKQLLTRAELDLGEFQGVVQVATNAQLAVTKIAKMGSVIDIDISWNNPANKSSFDLSQILVQAHEKEKLLFFQMLKADFLEKLNPQY